MGAFVLAGDGAFHGLAREQRQVHEAREHLGIEQLDVLSHGGVLPG
jgi:hypothetical protein